MYIFDNVKTKCVFLTLLVYCLSRRVSHPEKLFRSLLEIAIFPEFAKSMK